MKSDYFDVEALSASGAKELLRSPAHYRYWKDHPKQSTPAMIFGTAVHSLILEPNIPLDQVCSIKTLSWATKEGKLEKERLEEAGLPVMSQPDADRAQRIRDIVLGHEEAASLLHGAKCEINYKWNGYAENVPCKGGIDALGPRGIVDLKTTIDASPDGFAQRIKAFKYHMQAAHYIDGVSITDKVMHSFTFIAVETAPPYAVACYQLDRNALIAGYAAMERVAKVYARCLETGDWPAYALQSQTLQVPYLTMPEYDPAVDAEDF
jgi:exodeoxyribonuclease VIII